MSTEDPRARIRRRLNAARRLAEHPATPPDEADNARRKVESLSAELAAIAPPGFDGLGGSMFDHPAAYSGTAAPIDFEQAMRDILESFRRGGERYGPQRSNPPTRAPRPRPPDPAPAYAPGAVWSAFGGVVPGNATATGATVGSFVEIEVNGTRYRFDLNRSAR